MMDEGAEPQGRSGSHTRGKTGFVSRLLLPPSDSLYTAWLDSFRPTQICSLLLREAGRLSTDSLLSLKDREAWRAAVMGSQEVGHDWVTEQQLCLTFEFGYCRALGRNPMGGGGDGWSICLSALFLSVHIRIAATLGQKSPFLSSSWLYLGRW